MNLTTYIEDMERRRALATAVGTSPTYLWQMATGWNGRSVGLELAPRIEDATAGTVRCEELRPDVQWSRDAEGRVTGYQVRLKPRKKIAADKLLSHGAKASRERRALKTPSVAQVAANAHE